MKYTAEPSTLCGSITIPSSKSHTQRALLFALLAKGHSRIQNPLYSLDTQAMLIAIQMFGAQVKRKNHLLEIKGVGGNLKPLDSIIDAKNSGIILRFITALSALMPTCSLITGDQSIQTRRSIQPLIYALRQLEVSAVSLGKKGFAPVLIKGPLTPGICNLDGQDSQPISALLIATAFAQGPSQIHVDCPGEKPWIDLTLSWLDFLNIPYINHNYTRYEIKGSASISSFDYTVPGDFSSLLFPVAAALITQSSIAIQNVDQEDVQGDKKVLNFVQEMGAVLFFESNTLYIEKTTELQGKVFDLNDTIDALPILAVIGCFAKGETVLKNAKIARTKESDRIHGMATELKKMGAHIEETEEGLRIRHSPLKGATLETYQDHRIAMSLTVAALGAQGKSVIKGVECIAKTYPNFKDHLTHLGAFLK